MSDYSEISPEMEGQVAAYDWLVYYTPIRSYPPLADRKATATLAAVGLLVSVLLMFSRSLGQVILGPATLLAVSGWLLLAILAVLLLIAAWLAFIALNVPVPPTPETLAFFPHIAGRSRDDYLAGVKSMDARASARAMLNYNYSLSVQSTEKFRLLGRATSALHTAFVLWLLILVGGALQSSP